MNDRLAKKIRKVVSRAKADYEREMQSEMAKVFAVEKAKRMKWVILSGALFVMNIIQILWR